MKIKYFGSVLWLIGLMLFSACRPTDTPVPAETRTTVFRPAPEAKSSPAVLFLGNSLSAGLGVRPEESFPSLIQKKIEAEGWPYQVINGGLSGDTSAGGLRRIKWMLQRPVDVMVLELGGNDGLRGIPPEVTNKNLEAIVDSARSHYPDIRILLAGMQMPPNLGEDYTARFREVYPALAARRNLTLIPFLLEDVGGNPSLNQSDGIHPTAAGHRIVAETVWHYLRPVLEADIAERANQH